VVLAGGVSERFRGDKLLHKYEGEEIIRRICKAAKEITEEIYISTRTRERAEELAEKLRDIISGYIIDDPNLACEGPLAGIASSAKNLMHEFIMVISGDVPRINGRILGLFFSRFRDYDSDAGSVVWGNGSVETLIQIHKSSKLRDKVERICSVKREFARPSDLLRGAEKLALIHVRNLTDNPLTFSNINKPEDLTNPKPRAPLTGFITDDLLLSDRHSVLFWEALENLAAKRYNEAIKLYLDESNEYLASHIHHLAGHAVMDASLIADSLIGDREEARRYREISKSILSKMDYEYG